MKYTKEDIEIIKNINVRLASEYTSDFDRFNNSEKKKIYILGPMRGYKNYNYESFFEAEKLLSEQGWLVLNPARNILGLTQKEYLQIDLQMVFMSDAVYRLYYWEYSKGARVENALAEYLTLEIIDEK